MQQATYEIGVPTFQGDLMLMRVEQLPAGLKEEKVKSGFVAAHSETGHHHVVNLLEAHEAKLFRGEDPFVCYLSVDGVGAEVVHKREFDTHEGLALGPGIWMLGNQVEYSPEGWRRAAD